MRCLGFFMPMVPPTVTFQDRRSVVARGRGLLVDTPELVAAKAKLLAHLGPHAPAEPFAGPVRVVSKWCWPCEGTAHVDGEYRISKPDADNLGKTLHDLMEDLGFFVNDAQVMPVVETFWADVPGVYVRIDELADPKWRRSA